MPRLYTRPYPLRLFETFCSMILFEQELTIRPHLLVTTEEHKISTFSHDRLCILQRISLPSRHRTSFTRTPTRCPRANPCRATNTSQFLRKRNDIPIELAQTARKSSHKVNLHVLKRYQHGFDTRRTIEKLLQLIMQRLQTCIRVMFMGTCFATTRASPSTTPAYATACASMSTRQHFQTPVCFDARPSLMSKLGMSCRELTSTLQNAIPDLPCLSISKEATISLRGS